MQAASAFKGTAGPSHPSCGWASSLLGATEKVVLSTNPWAVTEAPSYHFVYFKASHCSSLTVHTRIRAADTSNTGGEQGIAKGEHQSSEHFCKWSTKPTVHFSWIVHLNLDEQSFTSRQNTLQPQQRYSHMSFARNEQFAWKSQISNSRVSGKPFSLLGFTHFPRVCFLALSLKWTRKERTNVKEYYWGFILLRVQCTARRAELTLGGQVERGVR